MLDVDSVCKLVAQHAHMIMIGCAALCEVIVVVVVGVSVGYLDN